MYHQGYRRFSIYALKQRCTLLPMTEGKEKNRRGKREGERERERETQRKEKVEQRKKTNS